MALFPVRQKLPLLRVLGIDPASAGATGYAVIETDPENSGRCRALHYGAWRPARGATAAGKLRDIHKLVAGLVAEFAPGAVAVEAVFTALNITTALRLAEVRGVVMLAAAEGDIPVESYSPRDVKASLTGYGQASKHQMQDMVRSQLCLPARPEPADAADAMAIALCHIFATRAQARMTAASRPASPAAVARIPTARINKRG
jgi:crossover junction endodeoxyribonuclease RuvC